MRRLLTASIPLFFFLAALSAHPVLASGDPARQAEARALEKRLYDHPYWRTLLHYQTGFRGLRSRVDDPGFFLSENGATDPRAELLAFIRALYAPLDPENEKAHAACRFPARLRFVVEELGLDPSQLPMPECRVFREMLDRLDPVSASIVFPAAYMNSPASLFGHTLLTIRTRQGTELTSQAVNYAAVTTDTFGPSYAVKGIFGLYRGYFSMQPYYVKIQEYSDVSRRDIWQYTLNLSPEEIGRMFAHLYEMEGIWSDYFFFDENCSHALLFLLDAARPGLGLADQAGLWVIPVDTLRLALENGLAEDRQFRPSKATRMQRMADRLSGPGLGLALSAARGAEEPGAVLASGLPDREKGLALDLSAETLQFLLTSRKLTEEAYRKQYLSVLKARSTLAAAGQEAEAPAPPPAPPEDGHRSALLAFGGQSVDGEAHATLRFRPAYHGLVDDARGFAPGAQIFFGDFLARMSLEDNNWEMERMAFIDILSIAPRDALFSPVSWAARLGFERRVMDDGTDDLVGFLTAGRGWAWEVGPLGTAYGFAMGDSEFFGRVEQDFALGPAVQAGLLSRITDRFTIHAFSRYTHFVLGDYHDRLETSVDAQVHLSRNHAVQAEAHLVRSRGFWTPEYSLAWNLYF
ncbi:MAG: DUF4105 domain-containing protein [Pseudomonadota bacterium]